MANYYYVNSTVALNAGVYTSLQTGAWPTSNFTTVGAAMGHTTAPVSGDLIIVSTSHSETISSATIVGLAISGGATYLRVISTDNANCENYTEASTAQFTVTSYIDTRQSHWFGIYFQAAKIGPMQARSTDETFSSFIDCKIHWTGGSSDYFLSHQNNSSKYLFNNCDFVSESGVTNASIVSVITGPAFVELINCRCSGAGTWLGITSASTRNCKITATGCDLSPLTNLLADVGGTTNDRTQDVVLNNCKVRASVVWVEEIPINADFRFEAFGCTDSTSDNPNMFHIESFMGTVDSEFEDNVPTSTGVVRTDGTTMSGEAAGIYMSAKAVTLTGKCDPSRPFSFELPVQWSALSVASTDTVRVYICGPAGLTDTDISVSLMYRDGTDIATISNVISSTNHDPLAAGTALTTDASSTWTNSGALSKYQIDLVAASASDCAPSVVITLMKDNITVYFDTEYGLVA